MVFSLSIKSLKSSISKKQLNYKFYIRENSDDLEIWIRIENLSRRIFDI